MEIPIIVVAYNREKSLQRLLNSLNKAYYDEYEVDLIISIDKSNNDKVYDLADEFNWKYGKKSVIKQQRNLGLREHVLNCGDLVTNFDAIIMLEDDLVVSKSFYRFSLQAVGFFYYDDNIGGISLYNYPISEFAHFRRFIPMQDDSDIFFMNVPSSWGQIWTKDQWMSFRRWYNDNEYKNINYSSVVPKVALNWGDKSWKKYFYMYIAQYKKYIVYPRFGLSTNMGEIGTHHEIVSTAHQSILMGDFKRKYYMKELTESNCVYDAFMENEKLYQVLNLDGELTVDYYGVKNISQQKGYLLTTRNLNFKVLHKWGLSLKPYEQNVIFDIQGDDLYLYDLSEVTKRNIKGSKQSINLYKYDMPGIDRKKAFKVGLYEYKQAIIRKIKKVFNRKHL